MRRLANIISTQHLWLRALQVCVVSEDSFVDFWAEVCACAFAWREGHPCAPEAPAVRSEHAAGFVTTWRAPHRWPQVPPSTSLHLVYSSVFCSHSGSHPRQAPLPALPEIPSYSLCGPGPCSWTHPSCSLSFYHGTFNYSPPLPWTMSSKSPRSTALGAGPSLPNVLPPTWRMRKALHTIDSQGPLLETWVNETGSVTWKGWVSSMLSCMIKRWENSALFLPWLFLSLFPSFFSWNLLLHPRGMRSGFWDPALQTNSGICKHLTWHCTKNMRWDEVQSARRHGTGRVSLCV